MPDTVRRGYLPGDIKEFTGENLKRLHQAAGDMRELLNRGYPGQGTAEFIGNHYQLTVRQRLALRRISASDEEIRCRREKELDELHMAGSCVSVDGFNTLITLETALSGGAVLLCMDGTCRDLAEVRGSYRLIDKTDTAIRLLLGELQNVDAACARIVLDQPVSNSGRLKVRIAEIAEIIGFRTDIQVVDHADRHLLELSPVATSDSAILDRCASWVNLNRKIIQRMENTWLIEPGES